MAWWWELFGLDRNFNCIRWNRRAGFSKLIKSEHDEAKNEMLIGRPPEWYVFSLIPFAG